MLKAQLICMTTINIMYDPCHVGKGFDRLILL